MMQDLPKDMLSGKLEQLLHRYNLPKKLVVEISKDLDITIFYKYIQDKFKEKLKDNHPEEENTLPRREAKIILGRYKVPPKLQVTILEDMENLELIQRKNKRTIIIL